MWAKLTYSKKSLAIVVGFILFMVFGYKLSFVKTFELKKEIGEKERKIAWLKAKEKEIPFLKAKMQLIEEAYSNDSTSIRDKLTAYISDFAENNNCLVTEIPSYTAYKSENLNIQTNIFTVKGKFNDLLSLLMAVETKFKISAKLMSARFFSVKDMQTKRKSLYLTLVTQSFNQQEPKNKE
jgi:hypothetical protein